MNYLVTKLPADDCFMPVQLSDDRTKDTISGSRLAPLLPMTSNTNVSGFGRQAQAIYLLDQAFSILTEINEPHRRISALKTLDGELQNLLTITMGEYRGPGSHCGANAIVLRYYMP